MTVSPVDSRLYISDYMNRRIIHVKTMGPVRELEDNFEVVAGTGDECTPGERDLCGDGKQALTARFLHPKGIHDSYVFLFRYKDKSTLYLAKKCIRNNFL